MYRRANQSSITPYSFELPFAKKLSPDNRWVIVAELIPWADFEREYKVIKQSLRKSQELIKRKRKKNI